MRWRRWSGTSVLVAGLLVVAAACSSGGGAKTAPTTGGSTATSDTSLGQGVTAHTIKLGVLMIDFPCLNKLKVYDSARPDQEKTYRIFIDQINNAGGINGRTIEPVFKTYCPINNTGELAACTSLTDDQHVFAVVGIFYDPSGDAQLCFAKRHHTIVVADSLTEALIKKAPPGLLLTPNIASERRVRVILSLLKQEGTLAGKKVAVVTDPADKPIAAEIEGACPHDSGTTRLCDLGVARGTDGVLSVADADTTRPQAQLDSLIERWKGDGTNAVLFVGSAVDAKQFVEKIKKSFPGMLLLADNTNLLDQGREEQKDHVSPNPYTGSITAEGQTGVEHTRTPHFTFCRDIFEKATNTKVPSPNVIVRLPDGLQNDIYGEVEDACLFPNFFAAIAKKAGQYLNDTTWVQAVNTYGSIEDMNTLYASIHEGKYDADDTYGLVAFDPTIGADGDWSHVTPVRNVTGS